MAFNKASALQFVFANFDPRNSDVKESAYSWPSSPTRLRIKMAENRRGEFCQL